MAGIGILKEAGLRLLGVRPTQQEDLMHYVPQALMQNGGVPPLKPEEKPRRKSARAIRRELEAAAKASFTSGRTTRR